MVDRLDRVALDGAAHEGAVLDRAQHGDDLGRRGAVRHRGRPLGVQPLVRLALDLVERSFAGVEQHQPAGALAQDLPHQLRADRAAGARHQHRLARDVARQQRGVGGDWIAPQQVLRLDRAQVADRHAACGQVLDRRQCAHAHHQRLELPQRGLALLPPGLGHRQQHLAHVVALHDRRQTLGAVHLEAGDVLAPQRGVHVDEADRLVGARAAQLLQQLYAGRAGAVDQHVVHPLARAHGQLDADAAQQEARHLARAPDEGRAQDRIEDDDRAGHHQHTLPAWQLGAGRLHAREEHEQGPHQRRKADRDRDQHRPLAADVARHQTVEPELEERGHADRRRRAENQEQPPRGRHIELAEPRRHGQPQREAQHQEVADGRG